MGENIDTPFLLLWSCKGSSNCLYLDQAVLHVRCLPWLRRESWSTKKNGRHLVIGSPSRPRAPKISRITSLAAHAPFIGCTCAVHGAIILTILLIIIGHMHAHRTMTSGQILQVKLKYMNETTVIEQFLCTAIFRIPKMKVTGESRFKRNLSTDTGALQYLYSFKFSSTAIYFHIEGCDLLILFLLY